MSDLLASVRAAQQAHYEYGQHDHHNAPLADKFENEAWGLDWPAIAAALEELAALRIENASVRESLHYANGVADVNIADNERLRTELAALREKADKAVRACCHAAHRTHDYATWCSGCSEVDDVVLPGFLDAKEGGR